MTNFTEGLRYNTEWKEDVLLLSKRFYGTAFFSPGGCTINKIPYVRRATYKGGDNKELKIIF